MIDKNHSSPLLISEPPLQLLPTLAKNIGLHEAIVLQQIQWWFSHKQIGITRNGYKWIYNSYSEWKENFPFWCKRTIQNVFLSLERKKLIVSCQLNKSKGDRTKFYRINYDCLEIIADKQENDTHDA